VLAEIVPPWRTHDARALSTAIHEAVTSLWGDAATALMQPSVVHAEQDKVIVRCRRGTERDLILALSTVISVTDCPVALRSRAVSGTILALKERGISLRKEVREEEVQKENQSFTAYCYQGHKVDLLERGIKGQNIVFFTDDDIEEL
jgi:ribonuclease P/MRP protein subunit POP5